jgi:starch synthase (maltosyl-transferring)
MATRTQSRGQQRATAAAAQFAPIVIEGVTPELDCGRYPVKRVVGDACAVAASIFKDGHDLLAARVRFRGPNDDGWRYAPMAYDFASDRWSGAFPLDRIGRWTFTVEGWTDRFGTWHRDLEKKRGAGQDVSVELLEGAELIDAAARRAKFGAARSALARAVTALRATEAPLSDRVATALTPEVIELMQAHAAPTDLTTYSRELAITVDRRRAGFASWYELFPRSQGSTPGKHGTFADAERRLPRLAELGFDVIYLPPIHPIGHTFRKGKNNSLQATPDDVGSPWAIGNEHGGHTAIEPRLGTIEDFDRFVARANELGMEVALDYALQCSPDHPWVKEHPEWFTIRPDGTIQYAENPPKKYQDIYPLNFWTSERAELWNACRDVFLYWIEHGVKTFRVDNPHTKPFSFWEWCIGEVRRQHPDVVFLSEAFTRPSKLLNLAKLGFSQSYTYFTWKNSARELREFMTEFSRPEVLDYYRGNLFANTPDILHEFLQHGGRPAFRLRLLLAGTLSPLYGIYSGYELCENVAVRPGSEEYLNSEKYEIRVRDYEAPGNLNGEIQLLNRIRREQSALQRADNLTFFRSDNDAILCYRKAGAEGEGSGWRDADLLITVNLDPHHAQATMVYVPIDAMGIGPDESYAVHDLLTGARYTWRGSRNFVLLDPAQQPGHVLRVER